MTRPRVVHAAKFYPPARGGMETVVRDLCAGTAVDWDVRVIASNDRPHTVDERVDGVRVVRAARLGAAQSVPLCPSYPAHLWRQRADCVVLHEPNPVAGCSVFLQRPARLVVWHHSDVLRPRWAPPTYGRLQRALYRRADCVIVSSPTLAAASPFVSSARQVRVIPFGIDLNRFQHPSPACLRRAAQLRACVAAPLLLFVGRLVYYKGVDVLIDALPQCEGTLVIVGDGPLEAQLRRRALDRGVAARVRFVGHVPDAELPGYYCAADLFVLPSVAYTETFGVVQVEAMASGLPVVSTRLSTGVPWVNQDGVTGFTVEPGDTDALAAAIRRLTDDPIERARLGRGASARARSQFSRERMIASFRHVVDEVMGRAAPIDRLAGARTA